MSAKKLRSLQRKKPTANSGTEDQLPLLATTKEAFIQDGNPTPDEARATAEREAAYLADLKSKGAIIEEISLDAIVPNYLVRDRDASGMDEELASLAQSIKDLGQLHPIEIMPIQDAADAPPTFALISGYRRFMAMQQLQATEDGFQRIRAIVVSEVSAQLVYERQATENEQRAGVSYYEKAAFCIGAVKAKVFRDRDEALRCLYRNTSAAQRSKIGSFFALVEHLGDSLPHPESIPETLGLKLSKVLPEHAKEVVEGLKSYAALLMDGLSKAEQVKYQNERLGQILKALPDKKKSRRGRPAKPKSMFHGSARSPINRSLTLSNGYKLHTTGKDGMVRMVGSDGDPLTADEIDELLQEIWNLGNPEKGK